MKTKLLIPLAYLAVAIACGVLLVVIYARTWLLPATSLPSLSPLAKELLPYTSEHVAQIGDVAFLFALGVFVGLLICSFVVRRVFKLPDVAISWFLSLILACFSGYIIFRFVPIETPFLLSLAESNHHTISEAKALEQLLIDSDEIAVEEKNTMHGGVKVLSFISQIPFPRKNPISDSNILRNKYIQYLEDGASRDKEGNRFLVSFSRYSEGVNEDDGVTYYRVVIAMMPLSIVYTLQRKEVLTEDVQQEIGYCLSKRPDFLKP